MNEYIIEMDEEMTSKQVCGCYHKILIQIVTSPMVIIALEFNREVRGLVNRIERST